MADGNFTPYGVIYCIEHIDSGKRYIGQTTRSIAHRWWEHCYYLSNRRLGNAIRKYGKESFSVYELDVASSKEELDHLEKTYILMFKTTDSSHGYNLDLGGGSGKHSDESKAFMSNIRKGKKHSEETKKKISASQVGRVMTDKTREKMKEKSWVGRPHSTETRLKLSEINTGKRHSEETIKKLSDVRKELWNDDKSREAMRSASIEARKSESYKSKVSEISKQQWADDEKRSRLLEARAKTQEQGNAARLAAWSDPEKRARRLEKLAATRERKRLAEAN